MDKFVTRNKPSDPLLPDPGDISDPAEARATAAANAIVQSGAEISGRGKYKNCTPEQRAKVASYARFHGSRAAVRKFGVPYTTVDGWLTQLLGEINAGNHEVKALNQAKRGRRASFGDVDGQVCAYLRKVREMGGIINS